MTKALVVGYGSIGARHARLLSTLGCNTAVVSRRIVEFPTAYSDLALALSTHCPDYVVIANSTSQHYDTLNTLAARGFSGDVLIEKPLFDHHRPMPIVRFRQCVVGYNLRFHPVIQRIRELLTGEAILSANAYVGQYLPDWRPDTDYRQSYSASAKRGGGALRDLSHELDYLGWLFGDWTAVTALGGKVSPLEIDSDDLFVLLMQTTRCPVVSLQVSYLDRVARRKIVINTTHHTIEGDLIACTVTCNGKMETLVAERDHTYLEMHRALLCANMSCFCTMSEGAATLSLMEAAERANEHKIWIKR